VPADWPERFLTSYRKTGVRWRSAAAAGVSHDTVLRLEAADPAFAAKVEDARQDFADSIEENLHRLATDKHNVIANIVIAKKHRPEDFVERRQELHLHAHATVTDAEARALLSAMLDQATPATRTALAQPGAELPMILDVKRVEDPPSSESRPP